MSEDIRYRILGADGREYGPVKREELREWIGQGRASAQTRAKPESGGDWKPLGDFPELADLLKALQPAAPPVISARPAVPTVQTDDALATLIPYKNSAALVAYYLAVFSLVPCLGFILSIMAIIFGRNGLRAAREHPESKGTVHAWIGISLGGFVLLAHLLVIGVLIYKSISG